MANGWAGDNAVQDQIDATVTDAVLRAKSQLPVGPSLTRCEECDAEIPGARRLALPGVRLCISCQQERDRESGPVSGYNRRGEQGQSVAVSLRPESKGSE